jgi:hypothetical protein
MPTELLVLTINTLNTLFLWGVVGRQELKEKINRIKIVICIDKKCQ